MPKNKTIGKLSKRHRRTVEILSKGRCRNSVEYRRKSTEASSNSIENHRKPMSSNIYRKDDVSSLNIHRNTIKRLLELMEKSGFNRDFWVLISIATERRLNASKI
ncbi:hypothetical protein TorRG33x02_130150 [Trema orientale]|uniref:Uncharacterized protein n=1 Tax=Trema orientale TaxID=63057 RepID=A0A2P5F093_TREOI|nr:hypothetical protein TorRG33x02_130150 [Trema orientale]